MQDYTNQNKKKPLGVSLICYTSLVILSGCEHFSKIPTHNTHDTIKTANTSNNTSSTSTNTQTATKKQAQKKPHSNPVNTTTPLDANTQLETVRAKTAWNDILAAPGIDIKLNKRIKQQKEWYLKHPAFLSKVLTRAEPFLAYVIHEADKRKLPRALALLPIVESRYDPHAISKAGAVGTWQFMPATAQHFNLKMNWWFDGRRDVIASTDAALTYLSQLHQRFDNDWLLALAAYNAGGGNVNKSIRRNKAIGKATNYWSLKLPQETTDYVPRFLALLDIIDHAQKYNVVLPNIASKPAVTAVHTAGQVDIAQIANFAGLSETQFRTLNPGFRRWASDPHGPHMVLIPSHKTQKFKQALGTLPKDRKISWRKHKVKPGDTISQIAQTYNIPTQEFKRMNQLSSSFIKVGQALIIPSKNNIPNKNTANTVRTKNQTTAHINHLIQQGDTLWDISQQYNTSIRTIAAENNIPTRAPLKVGKVLTIRMTDGAHSQRVNYKVQAGDSLYGIAKRFKVSIGEIATWNALDKKNHIKPGQKLTLYLSDES